MSAATPPPASDDEPSGEQIVAMLFAAAMSGDPVAWALDNQIDAKLLDVWRYTHAQEYITYLENVLRMIRKRAAPG